MSSHNDDHNHSAEPKKVQFRTPLIMGFVTVLLIFLAVSTCDPKHACCENPTENCESKCEKDTTKHDEHQAAAEGHGPGPGRRAQVRRADAGRGGDPRVRAEHRGPRDRHHGPGREHVDRAAGRLH